MTTVANSSNILLIFNDGNDLIRHGAIPEEKHVCFNSAVHSRIWPNFELIRTLMIVLIACKNEEDPIKMKALEC